MCVWIHVTDMGRISLKVRDRAPWLGALGCVRAENTSQLRNTAASIPFCPRLWKRCDQLPRASAWTSLQRWTATWKCKLTKLFSLLNHFFYFLVRVFDHRNESRTGIGTGSVNLLFPQCIFNTTIGNKTRAMSLREFRHRIHRFV